MRLSLLLPHLLACLWHTGSHLPLAMRHFAFLTVQRFKGACNSFKWPKRESESRQAATKCHWTLSSQVCATCHINVCGTHTRTGRQTHTHTKRLAHTCSLTHTHTHLCTAVESEHILFYLRLPHLILSKVQQSLPFFPLPPQPSLQPPPSLLTLLSCNMQADKFVATRR